ncbi:hypothetical protein C0Q70_20645 [Pomacea canaliculata]|uniref:G-protein coupled receptors family 1 profile domain-containing protein n=1 Tax=Pomacea canaliculata TaxID=400727 RepID=A0A2T7NG50_POMCA|nr:hypothetical protein C0Q70_20645 [Pomacea canaliculata]
MEKTRVHRHSLSDESSHRLHSSESPVRHRHHLDRVAGLWRPHRRLQPPDGVSSRAGHLPLPDRLPRPPWPPLPGLQAAGGPPVLLPAARRAGGAVQRGGQAPVRQHRGAAHALSDASGLLDGGAQRGRRQRQRRAKRRRRRITATTDRAADTIRARKGVVKMLVASVVVYTVSYSPHQVHLLYNTFSSTQLPETWHFFVFVMVMTHINSAANPVLTPSSRRTSGATSSAVCATSASCASAGTIAARASTPSTPGGCRVGQAPRALPSRACDAGSDVTMAARQSRNCRRDEASFGRNCGVIGHG